MRLSNISSYLILGAVFQVKATIVNSRTFADCGYANEKIYCFGGDLSSTLNSFNVENALYSLDINQYYGKLSSDFNNKWNMVISNDDFDPEKRRTPEFKVSKDGKKIILVGGQNTGTTGNNNLVLANQTIMYDTVQNTWEKLPDYSETNRTERQIYFGTAVNLPSSTDDTIGYYGGFEDRSNTSSPMISVTGTIVPVSSDKTTSVRGFDSMTVFNITSQTWSYFAPQRNIPQNFFPNSQTATLNPKSGLIYYMGGTYYTPTSGYRFSFENTYVFDTNQGSWSLLQLTASPGSKIPSNRLYHSATMTVTDYCYTLNLNTKTWTEQMNVSVPTSVTESGARFGHSAVLVNTTLFILFGRDINGNPNPNLITFDIGNITDIQYTLTYPLALSINTDNNIPSTANSSSLSGGAKAGIAVGCVIGVAAIIAGAILFYRRKKAKQNSLDHGQAMMHVDWNRIESQYREMNTPPIYTSHAPNSFEIERQTPDVYDPIAHDKVIPSSLK